MLWLLAEGRVRNVDMKYNHAYYTTLHNKEILECERATYDQNKTKKSIKLVMFSVMLSIVL